MLNAITDYNASELNASEECALLDSLYSRRNYNRLNIRVLECALCNSNYLNAANILGNNNVLIGATANAGDNTARIYAEVNRNYVAAGAANAVGIVIVTKSVNNNKLKILQKKL